jgi:hypothetical protein
MLTDGCFCGEPSPSRDAGGFTVFEGFGVDFVRRRDGVVGVGVNGDAAREREVEPGIRILDVVFFGL